MENMTKELTHLKLYNWRTLCGCTGEGLRGSFLIADVTCQECLRISSSGSVAAPKEEPKKHPDFPEWLQTQDGKSCMEWPISEPKYLQNRLFWAFDAGRNCVWDQYVEQKNIIKELTAGLVKAKKYVSEGADMFESAIDAQHTKQEFQNVAKSLDSLIKKSQKL